MGNSVSTIGEKAFYDCSALINVNLGNSVSIIESLAFAGCFSLKDIIIPNSVYSLGSHAFFFSGLESITLSNELTEIKRGTFTDTKLKSITLPGEILSIEWAYYNHPRMQYVFSSENLNEMHFLFSETTLSVNSLFYETGNGFGGYVVKPLEIEHLFIDRELEWGDGTDGALSYVKDMVLGSHVSNCSIPLSNCSRLETITCYSTIPPTIEEATNAQCIHCVIKVPYEALEAYQQADVWKNFWNLEGFDPNGTETYVDEIKHDSNKIEVGRYDLNGRRVSEDYDGISIIRYSDGSTKKIMNEADMIKM